MMNYEARDVEYDIADIIVGRPHGFTVGQKHFYLYPATLAKVLLMKRHIDALDVEERILRLNPFLEATRLVKLHREECCNILAYHTAPNTKKDLFDNKAIESRKRLFAKDINDEDLATLLLLVLTNDKTAAIIRSSGIEEERKKLAEVMAIKRKGDKNTLCYCGKTMFGTFIGQLKEMGYTDSEIVFEQSYAYLRMMLADKVVTVHVTDSELNEIPKSAGGNYYDANDPENMQKIMAIMRERGASVSEND